MRKNVLITGAARRIGAACARLLHGEGCNVIIHFNSSSGEARRLCDEFNERRENSAIGFKADLLDSNGLQRLASLAEEAWGGLDVLVNNASRFYPGEFGLIQEEDWNCLINSNLKAPFFLSQALFGILRRRKGCIINLVDIHAERGLPNYAVYSIAKAGLIAMTKCLAKDLGPEVRVNAIAPGAILWPDGVMDDEGKSEILRKVALRRCGTAEDIAKAARFLIFDGNYITGHTLTIDGGRTLFV